METSDGTEQIKQMLDSLLDLFRRRLLDDKAKDQTIDSLVKQLSGDGFVPLFRELLLVCDRAWDSADDFSRSLGDEIVAVLERYGVEAIPADGAFDPAVHKVVGVKPAGEQPAGMEQVHPGFYFRGAVLRPAQVILSESNNNAQ